MDTLTETGLLTLAGILVAFLLRCCHQIEQSRCTNINCWGIKCERSVLSEEYLERLKKEEEQKEEVKKKEIKEEENL